MSMNSVPIRLQNLEELQLQLLFEERMLSGFEKQAIKYCRWLRKLTEEQRNAHHKSLSRIAHALRTSDGYIWDISPDCECQMCSQWHSEALRELWSRAEAKKSRRGQEKKTPRQARPTFIYLMRDERSGCIKIGRAKNPTERERTLQSENPHVAMLLSMPADANLERELHQRYGEFRVRGEWFRLSQSQIEEITQTLGNLA